MLSCFKLNVDVAWWNFLADDKYKKPGLGDDIEALRTYDLDRGYLKFQVDSTREATSPDKKGVYITLKWNEGEHDTVSKVQFRGELMGKEAEFTSLIPFEISETYNGSAVTRLEESVKNVRGESGYAYPQVRTIPEFDEEKHDTSLVVRVEEAKRVHVRDICFVGNNSTRDQVLRREMRQMEGS